MVRQLLTDCWPSEDEVDKTETEGAQEGCEMIGTRVDEDGGGVEGHDID